MRSRVWCTDAEAPEHRFAYWRDEICRSFAIDLEYRACGRRRSELFFGRLATHELGPLLFTNTLVNACEIRRSERDIAQDSRSGFQFSLLLDGKMRSIQCGTQCDLAAGDLVVLDYRQPYAFSLPDRTQLFSVLIPPEYLERRTGALDTLFGRVVSRRLDAGSLAADFLRILLSQLDRVSPEVEERVATHVADIIATTLLSDASASRKISSPAAARILARAKEMIESELGNPELTPGYISGALGISIRYLNLIFEKEGCPVMRYVRNKRLDACRDALADSLQAHRRISDIAYDLGFGDLSFFNRSFRQRFGASPSEVRRAARPRRQDPGADGPQGSPG